jgi:hypothetical protein
MNKEIKQWKGKIGFLFLIVRPIKNPVVWNNFFKGYEEYINVYTHISGNDYDKGPDFWPSLLWDNRVEAHGLKHTATAWGTVSLVVAEGLLYKAALKDKQNKYFCVVSESDIPLWSFPEFYNMLNTKDKSYITMDSGKGDEDIFKDCFPEKYIPSTNFAKKRSERDGRKILLRTSHQWKILVRREAKEFVKMCADKKYIDSYDKCFVFNPERLAPDEYSFANWLVLRHGISYLKKNIINVETTTVAFDKAAIHAKEFKHIVPSLKNAVCEDKPYGYPFFARKFPQDAKNLTKELPINCSRKKTHNTVRKSTGRKRSRGTGRKRSRSRSTGIKRKSRGTGIKRKSRSTGRKQKI